MEHRALLVLIRAGGDVLVFPLIFLSLGVGVLALYGFSSPARARIDDYLHALRAAHEAHRAADAHLSNANKAAVTAAQHVRASMHGQPPVQDVSPLAPALASPSPASVAPVVVDTNAAAQVTASRGVDHAIAATVANQRAAQSTANAARIAQTGAERGAVADSAVKVLERGRMIEEALANLGVGQCGGRSYSRVTPQVRVAILEKLHAEGMTVTGKDPWDIDTQQAGVKLRAVWDPGTQVLKLIVTASALLAPCAVIWDRIDRALRGIIGQ